MQDRETVTDLRIGHYTRKKSQDGGMKPPLRGGIQPGGKRPGVGNTGSCFGAFFGIGDGEDAGHDDGKALPVGGVFGELLTTALSDGIKLSFAIVIGSAPFGGDPAALLEAD